MTSVTQRISQIKQPRGGFLPAKLFSVIELSDGKELFTQENIAPSLIGLCVDYLSRFMSGSAKEQAFKISLKGASLAGEELWAQKFLGNITGLDDSSISNACKLVGFDVVYRAGLSFYKPIEEIEPDSQTLANIRTMVKRSLAFFTDYGPVVKDGFTLEGAYTKLITIGDGDFLTADTLWDFKVSKAKPKKEHTLQLLIYYLMGIRSVHPEFASIKHLGLYNPRQNLVYILAISDIPKETIEVVEHKVIGY
ncbi:hypothetical protein [Streptococcus anginosus]|uniref:hypothetical protein n=1 Tax=Streptococcus anginosus TaxID=1328 RepID=UPI0018970F6C|nr:hypothetical protein [Streptococcus anginosus]MDB8657633.1 hypothetical protein [Streptococcus anginosus]MDX5015968.1 hypothetical protein [Streptococcus anginosus]MDX5020072.1 hypothetical protein [Streptococcus anginosus]